MKKYVVFPVTLSLLLLFLFPQITTAEETSAKVSGSVSGILTSIITLENRYILTVTDGTQVHTFTAAATTPCLFQGKLLPVNQLTIGATALVSYEAQSVLSILVLSTPAQETVSTVTGMYNDMADGHIGITIAGGETKVYRLADSVQYLINDWEVSYPDFFRMTLPGDDIRLYLNTQNEVLKITAYAVDDEDIGKTNPVLLE